ncbi:MAG: hypothetical protein AAFR55_05290, partial [Pseudomonadota bacterium]
LPYYGRDRMTGARMRRRISFEFEYVRHGDVFVVQFQMVRFALRNYLHIQTNTTDQEALNFSAQ